MASRKGGAEVSGARRAGGAVTEPVCCQLAGLSTAGGAKIEPIAPALSARRERRAGRERAGKGSERTIRA